MSSTVLTRSGQQGTNMQRNEKGGLGSSGSSGLSGQEASSQDPLLQKQTEGHLRAVLVTNC